MMKQAIVSGAVVGGVVGLFFLAWDPSQLGYALFAAITMGSVAALVAGSMSPGNYQYSYADAYPAVYASCTPSRGHELTGTLDGLMHEEFAARELAAWVDATSKQKPVPWYSPEIELSPAQSRYVAERREILRL